MAKFSAFDEHCSASALLMLLGNVPVFSNNVRRSAGNVRKARNDWGHCVFSDWDQENYYQRFTKMIKLVKALCLSAAIEKNVLDGLKEWEGKGTCHDFKRNLREAAWPSG